MSAGLERINLDRIAGWVDERTGMRQALHRLLDEPIRGGASWAYVFGSLLLFLFVLQAATGILLALYYVPSADHAHASVAYIQKAVPGGGLIRGLHHHGASLMIILVIAHLAQTFLYGAYKQGRELVWMAGVAMFLLVLAFAFTGYLLPWDQAAYFGTKVGTSIAGEVPFIGPLQERIMLGGSGLTQLTLSRFFAAHVFLLPLAVGLLAVLHVYLFRRAGPAGPFRARARAAQERFYPRQFFKDVVAAGILFAALVALAEYAPAELGPEADPTSDYLARPPWYFLPLFQLLKYFPGSLSVIPTVVVPGLLFAALLLAPFIDRRAERHPLRRPAATAMLAFTLIGATALGALSRYEDRKEGEVRAKLEEQEEEMRSHLAAPFRPQVISAAAGARRVQVEAAADAPAAPAAYIEHCAFCHGERAEGDSAPPLIGIVGLPQRSKSDLHEILLDARSYGLRRPMPASFAAIGEEERRRIVDWLDSLSRR